MTKLTKNTTRKMKNRMRAMSDAPLAIPPNPKIAAMIATIKKTTAQRSKVHLL